MKKSFFAGVGILLPLAITLWLIFKILDLLTKPFIEGARALFVRYDFLPVELIDAIPDPLLLRGSQLLILLALVVGTAVIGMLTRAFALHRIMALGEVIVHKIPIVRNIYRALKDAVGNLFGDDSQTFKQAVLVPFPRDYGKSIGLLSTPHDDDDGMVAVFIPATPNPLMGFVVRFNREDLIYLDMSVEEAMKTIVSCGVTCAPISRQLPG